MKSNEALFEKLNKQFTFYLQIIRWGLWPFTAIAVIGAIYLGYDLSNTRNELNQVHSELKSKKTEIELLHREIIIENKEFNSDVKLKYNELIEKFDSLNTVFSKIFKEHNDVIKQANAQLNVTSDKYDNLLDESKSLDEFSEKIRGSVKDANNDLIDIKRDYIDEIEFAKMGAEEKKKVADKYMNYNIEVFSVFRRLVKLNAEITYLTADRPMLYFSDESMKIADSLNKQISNKLFEINKLLNEKVLFEGPD